MKWKKITIKTIADAEDIIISSMYDIGLMGAQIEDNQPLTAWEKEQMFVDIPLPVNAQDDTAYLSFFVETGADERSESDDSEIIRDADGGNEKEAPDKPLAGLSDGVDNSYVPVCEGPNLPLDELLERMQAELDGLREFMDIGEGSITVCETEDKDWMNNWKEFFHQFCVDDLLILPSWEQVEEANAGKKILHIDPGTAFGTGMHETTQLCIWALKKYITSETRLLDVGTGSGILAIVSLLYGIAHAVGTDLDTCAEPAVEENLRANGLSAGQFELHIGNLITDEKLKEQIGYERYDIVVANILAEVLIPLTPVAARHLKKGGIYITSGIICGKEQLVADACKKAGLTIVEITQQGEWMSVTARK